MKRSVLSACLLVLCMAVASEAIRCFDMGLFKGQRITGPDGSDPVTMVRFCPKMSPYPPSKWRRGLRVKDNCYKIPPLTIIAAFLDGNKYGGHAAVFKSCAPDGIWVYNQWKGVAVDLRLIPYGDLLPHYNADNFYVVEV